MPWFCVDDMFPEHEKVESLEGDALKYMAAITVWTIMGADCMRRLTDGAVTLRRIQKCLGHLGEHAMSGAGELVRVGLWEATTSGYQFHDWPNYQQTKIEIELKRRSKTERQKQWRSEKKPKQASVDAPVDALRDGLHDAPVVAPVDAPVEHAPSHPIPSHPIPNSPLPPKGGGSTPVELPDAPAVFRPQSSGGAFWSEVHGAFSEVWTAANRTLPFIAPTLADGCVDFVRRVAKTHGKTVREAALAIASAALQAPGSDPTWHLSRLDPFAPPAGAQTPSEPAAETPEQKRERLRREIGEANRRAGLPENPRRAGGT